MQVPEFTRYNPAQIRREITNLLTNINIHLLTQKEIPYESEQLRDWINQLEVELVKIKVLNNLPS